MKPVEVGAFHNILIFEIIHINSSTVLSRRPRRLGALAATGALTLLGLLSSAVCAQTSYVVKEIGVLPGFVSGVATSVNDAGDMTGYCTPTIENLNQMGFVVRKGILSAVGKLPKKGTYSFATFIHPTTGVVVGSADTGDSRPQGFVKKGAAAATNVFPNNGGNTHALRVDTAGKVYGYFIGGRSTAWQGGVWTPNPKKAGAYTQTIMGGNGIPYPVQQSLDPVTGAGWNILSMAGLNNVGQIAATGTKNGVSRALLLTPAPTPTPVP